MHWRGKWQPTPVFLPGESQGRGNLVGCCLQGHTESETTGWLSSSSSSSLPAFFTWFPVLTLWLFCSFLVPPLLPIFYSLTLLFWKFSNLQKIWKISTINNPKSFFFAKSLQSCLTLCDPIDGSPPGSPVPGTLQARTTKSFYSPTITILPYLFSLHTYFPKSFENSCIMTLHPTHFKQNHSSIITPRKINIHSII